MTKRSVPKPPIDSPPISRPSRVSSTRKLFSASGIRSRKKALSIFSLRSTYQVVPASGRMMTAGGISPARISRSAVA